MRTLVYIILHILLAGIIIGSVIFAMDREVARQEYNNRVRRGEFEKPIVGCLYDWNCEYYTNLLRSKKHE